MLSNFSWVSKFAIFTFLISIFAVNWQIDRTEFSFIFTFYAFAFISYLILIRQKDVPFKTLLFIAIIAQLISLIYPPNLSIDYYRFLWDGEMAWININPFDFKPVELIHQPFINENDYYQEIYGGLSTLSQGNYSCYPTVNQFYFLVATAFSSSVIVNTIILKLLIVSTELIGGYYLIKLLKALKINRNRIWFLFLNPLWIIECTGNTHFEGVMLSFLFIALYFIFTSRIIIAGLFFALAIQIKLIPLLLLPFFYRFLGFWKSIMFYSLTISIAIAFGFIHLDASNIYNFIESLTLYFKVFEFNSLILFAYLEYGRTQYDWGMLWKYGPQLAQISVALIVTLALYGQITDWKKLFNRMTLGFFIYLMLSSTLHPWYVLPLLALSMFTNYTFAIAWSFTIFLSYFFYTIGDSSSMLVRSFIYLEYFVVIIFFGYEIIKKKPLLPFMNLDNYTNPIEEKL